MPKDSSKPGEEEEYIVYSYYESTLGFYEELAATSPRDAVEKAVRERDQENLLPIKEGYQSEKGGFQAIRKENIHIFHHQ